MRLKALLILNIIVANQAWAAMKCSELPGFAPGTENTRPVSLISGQTHEFLIKIKAHSLGEIFTDPNRDIADTDFKELENLRPDFVEYVAYLNKLKPRKRAAEKAEFIKYLSEDRKIAKLIRMMAEFQSSDYLPYQYEVRKQYIIKVLQLLKMLPTDFRPRVAKVSLSEDFIKRMIHPKDVSNLYDVFSHEHFAAHREVYQKLAGDLIRANAVRTARGNYANLTAENQLSLGKEIDPSKITLDFAGADDFETTGHKYAMFSVTYTDDNAQSHSLTVRTNGKVMFLDKSWMYRQNDNVVQRFFATTLDGRGRVRLVDQGRLILSTLPEDFQLSRSMSETERLRWVDNEPFWSHYGQKVHFAPNFYKFRNEPYLVNITKTQLQNFYNSYMLEINSYDLVGSTRAPGMVMTKLGMEFECVFVGTPAISRLQPILRDQLRQRLFQ